MQTIYLEKMLSLVAVLMLCVVVVALLVVVLMCFLTEVEVAVVDITFVVVAVAVEVVVVRKDTNCVPVVSKGSRTKKDTIFMKAEYTNFLRLPVCWLVPAENLRNSGPDFFPGGTQRFFSTWRFS